jgi:hypothetical protein
MQDLFYTPRIHSSRLELGFYTKALHYDDIIRLSSLRLGAFIGQKINTKRIRSMNTQIKRVLGIQNQPSNAAGENKNKKHSRILCKKEINAGSRREPRNKQQ